jgi:hypothetical protein
MAEKPIKASDVEPKQLDETEQARQQRRQAAARVRARQAALKRVGAIPTSGSDGLHGRLEARLEGIRRNVSNGNRAKAAVKAKMKEK